jgi:predicted DNA-binding transcriptional regulator YafY
MPLTKNSFIRYQIIDACLRNRQRPFPTLEGLLEKCRERLDRNISKSAIEKDIRAMRELPEPGYYAPIAYDRLNRGYCYTDSEYSISNIRVKDADIDAIEFAARILRQFRGFPIVGRYAEAIDRILDVVDVRRLISQEELEEYVQFETPVYVEGSGFIEQVISAIKERKALQIDHQSFNRAESSRRIVHPCLLKEYRNRWYLVGLDDEIREIRTFGLDRIKSLEISMIPFRRPDFSPKEYFRHTIGMIAPQEPPPVILLEFRKQQARYLLTQPIHASQQVVRETDETVVFSFEVHPTYEFISFILGYGKDVIVVSPPSLKDELKRVIGKMQDSYTQEPA